MIELLVAPHLFMHVTSFFRCADTLALTAGGHFYSLNLCSYVQFQQCSATSEIGSLAVDGRTDASPLREPWYRRDRISGNVFNYGFQQVRRRRQLSPMSFRCQTDGPGTSAVVRVGERTASEAEHTGTPATRTTQHKLRCSAPRAAGRQVELRRERGQVTQCSTVVMRKHRRRKCSAQSRRRGVRQGLSPG